MLSATGVQRVPEKAAQADSQFLVLLDGSHHPNMYWQAQDEKTARLCIHLATVRDFATKTKLHQVLGASQWMASSVPSSLPPVCVRSSQESRRRPRYRFHKAL